MRDEEAGAEGAVAVHVLYVALEVGVGVMDDVVVEGFEPALEGDGLVDGALGEADGGGEVGGMAAEEAELGVGIEAAVAEPAIEEEVAAAEKVGVGRRVSGEESAYLYLELGGEFFVGVEREDPLRGALLDGGVLLGGEALPGFGEYLDVLIGGGDFEGAVGGAGVDEDYFVGEADAGEGAREVLLLIECDDGDGQSGLHAGRPFHQSNAHAERIMQANLARVRQNCECSEQLCLEVSGAIPFRVRRE